ncbi:hypothetical protein [Streptomyces sp. 900105245]
MQHTVNLVQYPEETGDMYVLASDAIALLRIMSQDVQRRINKSDDSVELEKIPAEITAIADQLEVACIENMDESPLG